MLLLVSHKLLPYKYCYILQAVLSQKEGEYGVSQTT